MLRTRIRAVALRELVAVTVVAGLLIGGTSLTTPQLAKEKLVAACANNIGRILEGMATWSEENNGMILGSPSTSGALFLGDDYDPLNPPLGICQVWDWAGPLEQLWGYSQTGTIGERFDQIRRRREFRCPANRWMAPQYGGDPAIYSADTGVLQSYNTGRYFMYPGPNGSPRFDSNRQWRTIGVGVIGDFLPEHIPDDYGVFVENVGSPACKMFIADGAVYSTVSNPPDFTLYPFAGFGGSFSASGPYSAYSRSWDRSAAWNPAAPFDARLYAYRHGTQEAFQPLGAYKMNVGFFDGHVALMDDVESANPHIWTPTGTTLDGDYIFPDVQEDYFGESTQITIGDCVPAGR